MPGATLLNAPVVLLATMLFDASTKLYVTPLTGDVTFTDPPTVHVGCIAVIAGADGAGGCGLITTFEDGEDVQPDELVTVNV